MRLQLVVFACAAFVVALLGGPGLFGQSSFAQTGAWIATPEPTDTGLPPPPTKTPKPTATPTETPTPSPTPEPTPTPAPTPTPKPTRTPLPLPPLGGDDKYQPVQAAPGDGSGTAEDGDILPPIAGTHAIQITGTVLAPDEQPGPKAFFVGTVDSSGHESFFKSVTDRLGHFRIPQLAGAFTSLFVFRHFDKHGRPDPGGRCDITDKPIHVPDTQMLAHVPSSGPAVLEANSSYDVGAQGQGYVELQTRGTNPANAKILLDGSDKNVDTEAASDRSVVGKIRDDATLGSKAVGVKTDGRLTNTFSALVVRQRFDPLPPLKSGSVVSVTMHIDGLRPQDTAVVIFTVGGAATLADGGATATVPVKDGVVTVRIRGVHAGTLNIRTDLEVTSPDFL